MTMVYAKIGNLSFTEALFRLAANGATVSLSLKHRLILCNCYAKLVTKLGYAGLLCIARSTTGLESGSTVMEELGSKGECLTTPGATPLSFSRLGLIKALFAIGLSTPRVKSTNVEHSYSKSSFTPGTVLDFTRFSSLSRLAVDKAYSRPETVTTAVGPAIGRLIVDPKPVNRQDSVAFDTTLSYSLVPSD